MLLIKFYGAQSLICFLFVPLNDLTGPSCIPIKFVLSHNSLLFNILLFLYFIWLFDVMFTSVNFLFFSFMIRCLDDMTLCYSIYISFMLVA